jgi:Family of unknown function (DUF5908)
MPIEIRELVIRATVDPSGAAAGRGCGSASPKKGAAKSAPSSQAGGDEDVVQRCVQEVLRILDDKRER